MGTLSLRLPESIHRHIRADYDWKERGIVMKARKLPIGISGFEKLIGEGYYYIDKTPFIKNAI